MNSIGIKAKNALKNKINTKIKNQVLNDYILLLKKNKKLIIKKNNLDIEIALKKKNKR